MRKGKVFYKNHLAGIITETNEGEYEFQYNNQYAKDHPNDFITFTMPVREKPYKEKRLFPFFEGLIPEGWLLDIASKNWKINKNDRMGLLLTCCQNCIGAVSVEPITEEENGA
ncbi:HipA N-terminal domain-containing protein [Aureibaculum sp. A20]|uniref:HipA N-terminal domain-containing protein n=1 Tax=Aureibaculum flavum TaxID=2795986 RepID=A0ABS0WLR4_9FLAO|nr:HipA N-terminal domain-containing protein [Aureibaculum flavum]MBJ2172915.1 HipA N-terminal domain-containing protein [Aureibaculum flavum]